MDRRGNFRVAPGADRGIASHRVTWADAEPHFSAQTIGTDHDLVSIAESVGMGTMAAMHYTGTGVDLWSVEWLDGPATLVWAMAEGTGLDQVTDVVAARERAAGRRWVRVHLAPPQTPIQTPVARLVRRWQPRLDRLVYVIDLRQEPDHGQ